MMWSLTHFPSAMRSLNPTTRAKAIEIANELIASGYTDKQHVIALSVDEARSWARRQATDSETSVLAYRTSSL